MKSVTKPLVRECLAEMLATFVLTLFGCGAVVRRTLTELCLNEEINSLMLVIGSNLSLWVAGCVVRGISGCHANPAVSLAMACVGRLKWKNFLFYVIAQFIGAFLGAALFYGIYYDALMAFIWSLPTCGKLVSSRFFASYPIRPLSILDGLYCQVVGTAFWIMLVLVTDRRIFGALSFWKVLLTIALVMETISQSLGMDCESTLNPARDLGPRLFSAVAGWGTSVFSAGNNWWWIPVVGPMIGGLIAAFLYELVIMLDL
ncbi:aquaporin-9-like isoform X2 [Gouania willdenowi]|nr:aquaporin-9-like isoform X2 [Gouania willdenowi]XP_028300832.1 aquaporin-9-like isoform X2 [Gouania willdenowi]